VTGEVAKERQHLTTGVARSAYAVTIAVLGVPIFFLSLAAQRDSTAWLPATIAVAVLLLVLISLALRRVRITSEGIEYRTMFHTRRMRLGDIDRAEVQFGPKSWRDWWRPPVRLVVMSRGVDQRPLHVNLKVFPRLAVEELLAFARSVSQGRHCGRE
jgi:hypothetical protein